MYQFDRKLNGWASINYIVPEVSFKDFESCDRALSVDKIIGLGGLIKGTIYFLCMHTSVCKCQFTPACVHLVCSTTMARKGFIRKCNLLKEAVRICRPVCDSIMNNTK